MIKIIILFIILNLYTNNVYLNICNHYKSNKIKSPSKLQYNHVTITHFYK